MVEFNDDGTLHVVNPAPHRRSSSTTAGTGSEAHVMDTGAGRPREGAQVGLAGDIGPVLECESAGSAVTKSSVGRGGLAAPVPNGAACGLWVQHDVATVGEANHRAGIEVVAGPAGVAGRGEVDPGLVHDVSQVLWGASPSSPAQSWQSSRSNTKPSSTAWQAPRRPW